MNNFRNASAAEADILTEIAYRSEAYWGYDTEYMEKFREFYSVTQDFINRNPTVVIEGNNKPIGFYGILMEQEDEISLEYFFIEPEYIGHGYGKLLWNHLIEHCRNLGIRELDIVTSPQAKDFYVKMGAVHCGELESLLKKGRIIPKLIYKV